MTQGNTEQLIEQNNMKKTKHIKNNQRNTRTHQYITKTIQKTNERTTYTKKHRT